MAPRTTRWAARSRCLAARSPPERRRRPRTGIPTRAPLRVRAARLDHDVRELLPEPGPSGRRRPAPPRWTTTPATRPAERDGQLQHLGHWPFSNNAACSLTGSSSRTGSTCSVSYTETDDVSPTITAVYDGDADHPGSRSSTPLSVTTPLDTTSTRSRARMRPQAAERRSAALRGQRRHERVITPTGTVNVDSTERRRQFQTHELHAIQRQLRGRLHAVDGPTRRQSSPPMAATARTRELGERDAERRAFHLTTSRGSFLHRPDRGRPDHTCVALLMYPPDITGYYAPAGRYRGVVRGANWSNDPARRRAGIPATRATAHRHTRTTYGRLAMRRGLHADGRRHTGDHDSATVATALVRAGDRVFTLTVTPNSTSTSLSCTPEPAVSATSPRPAPRP